MGSGNSTNNGAGNYQGRLKSIIKTNKPETLEFPGDNE